MVLFKDISKSTSDLITRDFPHASPVDIEVKAVSSPITITTTGTVTGTGHDASIQAAYAAGAVKASVKVASAATTLDATIAAAKGSKFEGLSFQAKHDIKKGKATTELATEFFHNRCHTRVSYFPLNNTFAASTLFGGIDAAGAIKAGVSVQGSVTDLKAVQYSLGSIYSCKTRGLALALKTNNAPIGLPTEYVLGTHLKNGDLDFAVESKISTDLKASTAFVVSRSINKDTSYKFKFAEGKVAAALSQRLASNATLSLGVEAESKDEVKFGSKLFFTQ